VKVKLTLRRSLFVVACFGLGFGLLRFLQPYDYFLGFGTVYAPGYSESRFNSIRHGMTINDVEMMMGKPLKKMPGRLFGVDDVWAYSDRPNPRANYQRRWVVFRNGIVIEKLKDFWVD
jgi:hypothetical protein